MSQIKENLEPRWYVVHTYSGYENKVKANIEKTIENRHLEEEILEKTLGSMSYITGTETEQSKSQQVPDAEQTGETA